MKRDPEEYENDPEGWENKPAAKPVHKKTALGYLLKVELCGIDPVIWRSFTVPVDLTLADLHEILQPVMGWENLHLHGFRDEENCYGPVDEDTDDLIDETDVLLSDIFKHTGSTLFYDYDFENEWEHLITCTEVLSKETETAVTDGKRACPPEECGGVSGYFQTLENLADADGYDPAAFDAEEVNRQLNQFG